MDDNYKAKLVELLCQTKEHQKSALDIAEVIEEIHLNITLGYADSVCRNLGREWKSKIVGEFGKKESEYWIYKEGRELMFVLTFGKDVANLELGIYKSDNKPNKDNSIKTSVNKRLEHVGIGNVLKYPGWIWISSFDAWDRLTWQEILDGKMTQITLEILKEILKLLDDLSM